MIIIESENFDKIEDVIASALPQLSIDDRDLATDIFKKIASANQLKAFGLLTNEPMKLKIALYADEVELLDRCVEIAYE